VLDGKNMDSYKVILDKIGVSFDALIECGLEACIFLNSETVTAEWEILKKEISNGKIIVRGCGKHKDSQAIVNDFYRYSFGAQCQILPDPTNNKYPSKYWNLFEKQVGDNLSNYQVSHVWGKTKNPYSFMGLWNIVLVPKLVDPFTGHESSGDMTVKFQTGFIRQAKIKYEKIVNEYNAITVELHNKLASWKTDTKILTQMMDNGCKQAHIKKVISQIDHSFMPIPI